MIFLTLSGPCTDPFLYAVGFPRTSVPKVLVFLCFEHPFIIDPFAIIPRGVLSTDFPQTI